MNISRIVVFGDSLQDNGNLIKTLEIPGEPYDKGRFSDGKVASEYLTVMLEQKQATNNKVLLSNYAIGGAYTSGKNPKSLLTGHALSVFDQVDQFVADEARFQAEDLVMINGGGNNFLFTLHNEWPYFNLPGAYRVANDLAALVDRVIKLGAKNLLVWNVPDVTKVPAYEVTPFPSPVVKVLKKYIKSQVDKENKKLDKALIALRFKYPNVRVNLFDAHRLFLDVMDSPEGFGFENVTEACVKSFGGVDEKGIVQTDIHIDHDPVTHLFWDYVHPTTKAHKMLAEYMLKAIFPLS